jgi:hypothetical protein
MSERDHPGRGEDGDDRRHREDEKAHLAVIVNGTLTLVVVDPEVHLTVVIEKALAQTNNHGQPPANWELRDEAGAVFDPHRTVESYHFAHGIKLFLNLKAGVGGQYAAPIPQVLDPAVSIAKFDREIAEYRALEKEYRQRGWLLMRAEFPSIVVALAAPHLKPIPIVFGVAFDYTNYDVMPPSVHLVDPFTEQPYTAKECPTMLPRAKAPAPAPFPGLPEGLVARFQLVENLLQNYAENDVPFLCLPGVREYHEHPAHSGDAWELHRAAGAGRFVRLLEIIYQIGIQPITDYNVSLVPQIGFAVPRPAQ